MLGCWWSPNYLKFVRAVTCQPWIRLCLDILGNIFLNVFLKQDLQ
jgi:hypothetical protein